VFGAGAQPSLEVEHRHTRIKQYWKLDRALRTETVINDAYDFGVGRRLANLAALVEIGRGINARLIALERDAQRCVPAATMFEGLVRPSGPPERRATSARRRSSTCWAARTASARWPTTCAGSSARASSSASRTRSAIG